MNLTPLIMIEAAAGGGGSGAAIWEAMASTTGGSMNPFTGVVLTKPTGTVSTDLLIAIRRVVNPANLADMTVPAGWTFIDHIFADDFGDSGFAVWWAAGNVADGTWVQANNYATNASFDVHRISGADLTTPVSAIAANETPTWGTAANMPSPSVTAAEGDCIIAHYWQPQSNTAVGTPQSGYTRVLDATEGSARLSTLIQSDVAAGATGDITHGAAASFEGRAAMTLAIAAA